MCADLLVDIGNSCVTAALSGARGPGRIRRMPTSAGKPAAVRAWLHNLTSGKTPDGAAICSVVPTATPVWQSELRRITRQEPLLIRHTLQLGIRIKYPRPATIGADRLANAAAAFNLYGAPVIVADFGTALTVDAVDAGGHFTGGLIMPGPALFLDYLADRTAALPRIPIPPASAARRAIARSTRAAMRAGAILGWRGMFREAVAAIRAELPPGAAVCVTGGYARHALSGTDFNVHFNPHLTLHGIQIIMNLNCF